MSPQPRALGMFKPVIVLDPGHGGDDTGAQKNGTVEKNVVLAFSLMLRDKLNATGRYKVLMTRDTDVFVELNKRREFAEHNLAPLFVAVHADYAQSSARGATIYSLRELVANSLQRSARGEVSDNVLSDKELAAGQAHRWRPRRDQRDSWPISPGARWTGTAIAPACSSNR